MCSCIRFGTCSAKIWLDDLECSSRDLKHILSCDHSGVGVSNCQHSEDIAVFCCRFIATLLHLEVLRMNTVSSVQEYCMDFHKNTRGQQYTVKNGSLL